MATVMMAIDWIYAVHQLLAKAEMDLKAVLLQMRVVWTSAFLLRSRALSSDDLIIWITSGFD